jgi:branched-chain amino acid transport system permease protein
VSTPASDSDSGSGSGPEQPDGASVGQAVRDLLAGSDLLMIGVTLLAVYLMLVLVAFVFDPDQAVNLSATYIQSVTIFVGGYAMLTLALNLQWGYTGLFNIGVAGFMGVGVYAMAVLTAPVDPAIGGATPGFGLPLWAGLIGAAIVAGMVGLLTALPALRLRADYLAIVTVALSEIIRLLLNSQTLSEVSLFGATFGTGGASGINYAGPAPLIAGTLFDALAGPVTGALLAIGVDPRTWGIRPTNLEGLIYGVVLLLATAGFYWLLSRTGNSPFGRVLKAIREDELVARSLGKDTRMFKIKAFVVGCALMGVAGALWFGRGGFISPSQFRPNITFFVFIALIIGGSGSNTGSVIGGAVFAGFLFYLPQQLGTVIPQALPGSAQAPDIAAAVAALGGGDVLPLIGYTVSNISRLRFVAIGVILIWLIQRRPEGLLGHRAEPASSIDISQRPSRPDRPAAADGGETDE